MTTGIEQQELTNESEQQLWTQSNQISNYVEHQTLSTANIINKSNRITNEVNIEQQSFISNNKMNNTEIKILVEMEQQCNSLMQHNNKQFNNNLINFTNVIKPVTITTQR